MLKKKYNRRCWKCNQEYKTNIPPREPFWSNVTITSEINFLCPNCYNKLIKLLKLNV